MGSQKVEGIASAFQEQSPAEMDWPGMPKPNLTFTTLDCIHVLDSDYFDIIKDCLEKDGEKLEVVTIMADVQSIKQMF